MGRIKIHYAVLTLCSIATAAFGDSGWYDETHGGIGAEGLEHPTISMAAETVDIELKRDQFQMKASFTFVNDGPATNAGMYFPFVESEQFTQWGLKDFYERLDEYDVELMREFGVSYENPIAETEYPLPTTDFSGPDGSTVEKFAGFRVTVDGLELPVTLVGRRELTFYEYGPHEFKMKIFARWSVNFEEGQERTVVCEYDAPYSVPGKGPEGPPFFRYNLYTGGSWAGAIGKGRITLHKNRLDFDAPVWFESRASLYPFDQSELPPAELTVSDDDETITWSFKDYAPPVDVSIRVEIGYLEPWLRDLTFEDLGLGPGSGMPGETTVDNLNFRVGPDAGAERVAKKPVLKKGTPFAIIDSRGEWWNVRLADGTEGWIRWRYVNPDTGSANTYAEFVCGSTV